MSSDCPTAGLSQMQLVGHDPTNALDLLVALHFSHNAVPLVRAAVPAQAREGARLSVCDPRQQDKNWEIHERDCSLPNLLIHKLLLLHGL